MVQSLRENGWCNRSPLFLFGVVQKGVEFDRVVLLFKVAAKLLPLPQPPVRARTDARANPSAQRATQLRSVLARVYAVSIQNQIATNVP
jgi:hypothetical protein